MKRFGAILLMASALAGCGLSGGAPSVLAVSGRTAARNLAGTVQASLLINGIAGGTMAPSLPANWVLGFTDATTGQPIRQFEAEHGKFLHLIVVSQDLQTFAHLHPTLAPGSGTFAIAVDQPSSDPDNQDAARAITKSGPYLLFGEVVPVGQSDKLARFDLTAEGPDEPAPLNPDPVRPTGEIQKYFKADGSPGSVGDAYQVTLRVSRSDMQGMRMLNLAFNIQALSPGQAGQYAGVTDLEPWLGMPGHAILISKAGERAEDKVYYHMHSGMHLPGGTGSGGTGPNVSFMTMGQSMPPGGVYKVWGQFKRQDRVLTFPFVFQLEDR